MPEPAASLTRHRSFVLFWCARTFTNGAYMMQGVAVGWQIYELTSDPFDLGLVGLVQFVPLVALSVVIGQVADRFDRRIVVATCQVGKALAALALAIGTARGALTLDAMLAILFGSGTARAFEMPSIHALLPGIVPVTLLPRAIAASAVAQQTAVICGPSLGGLLYMLSPTGVYATCTVVFIAASVLISLIHVTRRSDERKPLTLETLFAGFRYIRSRPILLGAISLDLFAVLLGGVTALLPIYARDILQAGPWALGAGGRGARHLDRPGTPRHRRQRRSHHVCLGRNVRPGEPRYRTVDLGRVVVPRARDLRRLRRDQRRYPAIAGADAHPLRDAGPGAGGQLDVHGLLGLDRRISRRRRRGRAGRGAVRADRRLGHDHGDADLDVGIPATSPRRQIDAGGRSGAVTATLGPIKVRSFRARPRPRRHRKLRDVRSRHDWDLSAMSAVRSRSGAKSPRLGAHH